MQDDPLSRYHSLAELLHSDTALERGRFDTAQYPYARRVGRDRRTFGHIQMRDDGGDLAGRNVVRAVGEKHCLYSPSSLANNPFTARPHPASFRSRVAALIAGLKRCSSRQLSANFAGSG